MLFGGGGGAIFVTFLTCAQYCRLKHIHIHKIDVSVLYKKIDNIKCMFQIFNKAKIWKKTVKGYEYASLFIASF